MQNFERQNEHGYFALIARDLTTRGSAEFENIRGMGVVNTALARLYLECALYLASLTNRNHVASIVRDQSKSRNLAKYFYDHLVTTIQRLAAYLNTSPDDCLLFVHFVLVRALIAATNRPVRISSTIVDLNEKEQRDQVERNFCTFVNERVLSGRDGDTVEKLIAQFTNVLVREAGRLIRTLSLE